MNLDALLDALTLFALLVGTACIAAIPFAGHDFRLRLAVGGANAVVYATGTAVLATRFTVTPLVLAAGALLPLTVILATKMAPMRFVLVASTVYLTTVGWLWALRLSLRTTDGDGSKSSIIVVVGLLVLLVSSRREMARRVLALPSWLLLVAGAAAFAAPLSLRYATNGAYIGVPLPFGITVQTAEVGRILAVIWLAGRISAERPQLRMGKPAIIGRGALPAASSILRMVLPAIVGVGLGVLSNDYGPAFLLALVTCVMLAVAGMQRHYLVGAVVIALGAVELAQLFSTKIQQRFSQLADPLHHGEGLSQVGLGLAALSRGGWLGLGLGQGLPATIPRAGDDMLLAAMGEELGGIALLCCIVLVGTAFLSSMHLSRTAGIGAAHLAIAGLASLHLIQSSWAAGGNLALVPLTGIPFPLLAVSGSSLLTSMISIGLRLGLSDPSDAPDTAPAIRQRITALSVTGAAVLSLVLASAVGWVATSRTTLAETKDARAIVMSGVNRGTMITVDGVVVATTQNGSDGRGPLRPENAVRAYPAGSSYTTVVGVAARNGYQSGLERGLAEALGCSDPNRLTGGSCPTVKLTLDSAIQEASSRALAGRPGAVVVTEVETGNILAYVSNAPEPDANDDNVRVSTAMPGSVAKLVAAVAAHDAPHTQKPVPLARFEVGGQVFSGPGGAVCGSTLVRAIADSCNPYFAQLGEALGHDKLAATTDRLLNAQSHVSGMPVSKSVLTSRAGDPVFAALGAVGLGDAQVTPMAMAGLVTTIARQGRPTCLRLTENDTTDCSAAAINPTVAAELQRGMTEVVASGTAKRIPTLAGSAGKTGTAYRGNGRQNAWFVGYAPAEAPTVAITVLVLPSATKLLPQGAADAGSVAGSILQDALNAPPA